MPLLTVTPRSAQDSTLCFKKGHRHKVYIQTEGFRMTAMASEVVLGAAKPILGAGRMTGRGRLATVGGVHMAVRGVWVHTETHANGVSSLLRCCQAQWTILQRSACWPH